MMTLPDAVRDAWHLVAISRQLRAGQVRQIQLAGVPIALFRTEAGIGALVDRCPHRNYPLSLGRVVDGGLECPYHGWRFAASGACVAVPGCTLEGVDTARLSAAPIRVIERHGGIFLALSDKAGPEPVLPPDIGDPALDHFWWQQGVWRGRAYDAIENVMDPFHTSHLHHGYIRHRDRRLPVSLQVRSHGDSIDMVIEQDQPDLGLMSRFLERDRSRSISRYYPPTIVQARWEGTKRLTLCVTAFFTPSTNDSFMPFACFTTPRGLAPGWLKQAAIRLFLRPVVAQDREALARQAEVMGHFGHPQFTTGPGDLLGDRLHRLWKGDRIAEENDPPVKAML
ncbi:Rieske 2Fe-2S domain-containing protein [Altererythrobacter xixiisoli]|uniref:Rieske 2Fe-2S domain-containing protein n=2 Tax=Croceibacterium xixiisoli TaxID=1476466 RepID=A0A6I4TPZ1_9SPHN|nr:aromatic ring-hydroxylating dioxygenase subunit alpha [Croceibacterium xixiisoli]MXO97934.1 Rieske 2Fe-2S domain-containing protein [Croceibacterium xixiisoli]